MTHTTHQPNNLMRVIHNPLKTALTHISQQLTKAHNQVYSIIHLFKYTTTTFVYTASA